MKLKEKRKFSWKILLLEILMLVICAAMLLPFYYLVVNTLKTAKDVTFTPLALPIPPVFDSYIKAFGQMKFFNGLKNTVIITFTTMIVVIVFGSMAAYAISRRRHKVYKMIMMYFLLGFMVPVQTTMIPLFLIMQKLHLMNSLFGIIVLSAGGCTFAIFLYQGFINSVPMELEESAKIDGASVWQAYWRVIFPLLKPITVTMAIFHVMGTWNDFITPFLFLHSRDNATLMLELYRGVGEFKSDWAVMMCSMVIIMSPLVIFYLIAQKHIIAGLTSGAVKG